MSITDPSSTTRNRSGSRGAIRYSKLRPSGASTLTEHSWFTQTVSTMSTIDSRAAATGALAAMRSSTARSPAAIRSARLRSVMSVMLPRMTGRCESGKRTRRTSHGISLPSASR